MEPSTLVLKVISCQGLKSFNFFHKLSVYAVVYITNAKNKQRRQKYECLQPQKTLVDRVGGENPEWNQMMKFDLEKVLVSHNEDDDCSDLFLNIDLHCDSIGYGKRIIGKACVLLKDLIDELDEAERFVSYQVRTPGGRKPNGVINFSYKVKGKSKKDEHGSPEFKFSGKVNERMKEDRKVYSEVSFSDQVNGKTNKVKKDFPDVKYFYKVSEKMKNDGEVSPKVSFYDMVNGKTKNDEKASLEVKSSSEKICYPAVEVIEESRNICYPSLEDVIAPVTGFHTPSPKYEYNIAEDIYVMTPPHQYFWPSPEPWYASERIGCGSGVLGSPGTWTK